jgi:hypothetical protein
MSHPVDLLVSKLEAAKCENVHLEVERYPNETFIDIAYVGDKIVVTWEPDRPDLFGVTTLSTYEGYGKSAPHELIQGVENTLSRIRHLLSSGEKTRERQATSAL